MFVRTSPDNNNERISRILRATSSTAPSRTNPQLRPRTRDDTSWTGSHFDWDTRPSSTTKNYTALHLQPRRPFDLVATTQHLRNLDDPLADITTVNWEDLGAMGLEHRQDVGVRRVHQPGWRAFHALPDTAIERSVPSCIFWAWAATACLTGGRK